MNGFPMADRRLSREVRALRAPGVAGARAVAGLHKTGGFFGDAALLDFATGFFAVSDSPDRNPSASRRVMDRFAAMLGTVFPDGRPTADGRSWFEKARDALLGGAESILETIPSHESCTFTGVLVAGNGDETRMILLHTGDSVLLEYAKGSGEVRLLSESNFWMVGRTRRFYQVEELPAGPDCFYILATDGLMQHDLMGQPPCVLPGGLPKPAAVEDLPDGFIHALWDRQFHDDITMISLAPRGLGDADPRCFIEELETDRPVFSRLRDGRLPRIEDYSPVGPGRCGLFIVYD
ncbi:MAG TPA: hypothetical protein ENN21_09915 [Spirochaetes bacterium]|nr:hypothetical protein [Spirochaetota bacterium]